MLRCVASSRCFVFDVEFSSALLAAERLAPWNSTLRTAHGHARLDHALPTRRTAPALRSKTSTRPHFAAFRETCQPTPSQFSRYSHALSPSQHNCPPDAAGELDEGTHGTAGEALGLVVGRRGGSCLHAAGNVEVGVAQAGSRAAALAEADDELLEEDGRSGGASETAAGVAQVGVARRDLFEVGVAEGQAPEEVVLGLTGNAQLVPQAVGLGEGGRVDIAHRDHAGAGERGDVHERVGLVDLRDVGERIGEHEAALGVGVVHLDGEAVACDDNVTGLGRLARGHVLGERRSTHDVDGQTQLGDGKRGGNDGSGAAHVGTHGLHARAGLEADSSRVEHDTLADVGDGRRVVVRSTLVDDLDKLGGLVGAGSDREERVHALLARPRLVVHDHLGVGHVLERRRDALAKDGGRHEVGGRLLELARPVLGLGVHLTCEPAQRRHAGHLVASILELLLGRVIGGALDRDDLDLLAALDSGVLAVRSILAARLEVVHGPQAEVGTDGGGVRALHRVERHGPLDGRVALVLGTSAEIADGLDTLGGGEADALELLVAQVRLLRGQEVRGGGRCGLLLAERDGGDGGAVVRVEDAELVGARRRRTRSLPLRRDIDVLGGGGAVGVDTHDDTGEVGRRRHGSEVGRGGGGGGGGAEGNERGCAMLVDKAAWRGSQAREETRGRSCQVGRGLADRLVARPHRASEGGGAHCPAAGIQSLCLFWRLFFSGFPTASLRKKKSAATFSVMLLPAQCAPS
ncbi:hypothetical protein L1887_51536 [Cichorium endivia]|nr:hypothetical protein L1887_51536 [Cichorium endivia]